MYKMNVNKIRNIIVQLAKMPDIIYEYDKYIICKYVFQDYTIIFKFTDEHVFITYLLNGNTYINDEIISLYDTEYMNIVISEYASRIEEA